MSAFAGPFLLPPLIFGVVLVAAAVASRVSYRRHPRLLLPRAQTGSGEQAGQGQVPTWPEIRDESRPLVIFPITVAGLAVAACVIWFAGGRDGSLLLAVPAGWAIAVLVMILWEDPCLPPIRGYAEVRLEDRGVPPERLGRDRFIEAFPTPGSTAKGRKANTVGFYEIDDERLLLHLIDEDVEIPRERVLAVADVSLGGDTLSIFGVRAVGLAWRSITDDRPRVIHLLGRNGERASSVARSTAALKERLRRWVPEETLAADARALRSFDPEPEPPPAVLLGRGVAPSTEGFVFLALGTVILALRVWLLPRSFGSIFTHVMSLAIWSIPIFYFSARSGRARDRSALVVLPVALVVQVAQALADLHGLNFLLFGLTWIHGWRNQQRARGQSVFPGILAGGLFAAVGALVSLAQLFEIPAVIRLHTLDASRIERIDLRRADTTGPWRFVDSRAEIERIATALHATYPHAPNHEGVGRREPWDMRIVRTNGARPIVLRLGNGTNENPGLVWVKPLPGEDYVNAPLHEVLTRRLDPPLWSSAQPSGANSPGP